MFSLSDEIQKFEKLTMTLPNNIMTVDQRFLGGGIKMQDLIQQNSFIITEMRKMKHVFLNYCKLNDKIYKKIIEHEVNSNQHYNKIVALSTSMEKKIQSSDQETKDFRREIINKANELQWETHSFIKIFRQKLEKKVDGQNFSQRIKKIIQQYEEQQASSSSINTNQLGSKQLGAPGSAAGKKRRGLTLQDIEQFKSQITPLIDEVNQRVTAQNTKITQSEYSIQNMSDKIQKLQQKTQWLTQDIVSINKQIEEAKTHSKNEDQKLIQMLKETINERVWQRRFEEFNQKYVVPSAQNLDNKFVKSINEIKKDIEEEIKPKFIVIDGQIKKSKEKQQKLQITINKNEEKIENLDKKIEVNKQEFHKQTSQLNKKIQKLIKDQQSSFNAQLQKVQKEIKKVHKTMQGFSNTIQQAVLKRCEQKLSRQMKQIRTEMVNITKKTSEISTNLRNNLDQVEHIKGVVATKANFTDLVIHFDKKADKSQFKELQELINENPQVVQQNSQIFQQTHKNLSHRRKSQDKRYRRSTFTKRTTPVHTNPKGQQDSSRYLLVGWTESPQNTSKQYFKSANKNGSATLNMKNNNKVMRPSTANTLFVI